METECQCDQGKRYTLVKIRQGLFIMEFLPQKLLVFCALEENSTWWIMHLLVSVFHILDSASVFRF